MPTGDDAKAPQNVWELFDRFVKLDEPWKIGIYSFFPVGLGVVAFKKDRRIWAAYAITAVYLFLLTFGVRKLHPFTVWHGLRVRYFDVLSPFVGLFAGLFLALAVQQWFTQPRRERFAKRFESPRVAAVATLVFVALCGATSYSLAEPEKVLRFNARISDVATDAYVRGLPIVSMRDPRATWVVYAVLLDDKLLAKGGVLPPFDDARITEGNRWWLVRDPARYDIEKLHRLQRAGCAVEITVKKPGPISKMEPNERLPASCDRVLVE
jgi:hypothetical protein